MFRDLNARIRKWMGGDDPPEPDQAVLLTTVMTEMEAAIVRGKLEAFGIDAFARDAGISAAYAPGIGRWEVRVRHRDFIRAQQILQETGDDADR